MKLRDLFVGAAAIGALAVAGGASASNLIVNGGFEASSDPVTTPPGWTNIGHMDGVIPYSEFGPTPYEGLNFYDEGGFGDAANAPGDGIEQSVATVIGQHYTLTFGLSGENQSGVEIADVTIGGLLTQYTLTPDGSGTFQRPLTTQTINFTATGASTTIAFTTDAASPSFGANDPMIDGVIFAASGGGVPEPAAWAMMLAGFGMVGATVRRRKVSAVVA
jgi:PEP-CTERM motif